MAKQAAKRTVRCYLCGIEFTVSPRAMSTTCPGCQKAIKIEDVVVKSYIPVVDLQTCGTIRITKRGRVAAKRIQAGTGIVCDGVMEGAVETDGDVQMGPKAFWKGKLLQSRSLDIAAGAKLVGVVTVPWHRPESETRRLKDVAAPHRKTTTRTSPPRVLPTTKEAVKKTTVARETTARKTTPKKTTPKKVAAKKRTTSKLPLKRKSPARKKKTR